MTIGGALVALLSARFPNKGITEFSLYHEYIHLVGGHLEICNPQEGSIPFELKNLTIQQLISEDWKFCDI
jgi:hypothetical protein